MGEEGPVRDTAIAAYGEREMAEVREVVTERLLAAKTWDELFRKGGKRGKKESGADQVELATLLRESEKLEALWSLSRVERLGLDGALFGTMVTQLDYRVAAPSAVQVSHSLTVHRALDFETLEIARDDLEGGPQAAILLDASYASGLYVASVTIDHAQLLENVMKPGRRKEGKSWAERIVWRPWTEATQEERELAAKIARAAVVSILYASEHAMKAQTNARVYPSYVLAEASAKGGINLQGAFSMPVNERQTNNILLSAIERLRAYSMSFDAAYGMAEARAELIASPFGRPDGATPECPGSRGVNHREEGTDADAKGWRAVTMGSAEGLADWVKAQVLATSAG